MAAAFLGAGRRPARPEAGRERKDGPLKPTTILAALLPTLLLSCSAVEDALNCRQVCEKYQECFDSDYDVGECVDACTDEAAEDDDYSRRVDVCESCIDGLSCGEATFDCATNCVGIVP